MVISSRMTDPQQPQFTASDTRAVESLERKRENQYATLIETAGRLQQLLTVHVMLLSVVHRIGRIKPDVADHTSRRTVGDFIRSMN